MKIAVCLRGEARTWRKCAANIKKFFSVGPEHEVVFFGHTWSRNSWKEFHVDGYETQTIEQLDMGQLVLDLNAEFNFAILQVDKIFQRSVEPKKHIECTDIIPSASAANFTTPSAWLSVLYSTMMANHVKQQYEHLNNMKFDIVVSTRFDQCYDPSQTFINKVPTGHQFDDGWLFSEVVNFPYECNLLAINDVFYYGSSRVMDQVDSFYRIFHNGNFFKLIGSDYYDSAYKLCGCGVLLYKWCTLKNIYVNRLPRFTYQIVRPNTKLVDPIKDYHLLATEARAWGKPR